MVNGGEDRLVSLKTELNELVNKLSTDAGDYEDLYGEDENHDESLQLKSGK